MYMDMQCDKDLLKSLKLWVCSGETLTVSLAEQFLVKFPSGEHILANFYGSTEVMGDVTYYLINNPKQIQGLDKVPIGKQHIFRWMRDIKWIEMRIDNKKKKFF